MSLITVKEAAEILRVSTMTVRRYLHAGKIQGVKFNRDIKIDKDSLDEFLTKSKIGGNDNE